MIKKKEFKRNKIDIFVDWALVLFLATIALLIVISCSVSIYDNIREVQRKDEICIHGYVR